MQSRRGGGAREEPLCSPKLFTALLPVHFTPLGRAEYGGGIWREKKKKDFYILASNFAFNCELAQRHTGNAGLSLL